MLKAYTNFDIDPHNIGEWVVAYDGRIVFNGNIWEAADFLRKAEREIA